MTPIAAAITTDNGLKIETYTGPFKCKAHAITILMDEPKNP